MSAKKNCRIVDQWNEVVIGQRKLDLIDTVLHPDYHADGFGFTSRDEIRSFLSDYFAQHSENYQFEVLKTIAEDDYVIQLRSDGVVVYRFEDGLIRTDTMYRPIKPEKASA